jgi:hypothetical protein
MRTVLLRLLGNRGRYPEQDFAWASHLLSVSGPLRWSAVRQHLHTPIGEYSEVQVLSPEEVQLFAALALSVSSPTDHGHLRAEPLTHAIPIEIDTGRLDLRSTAIRGLLADKVAAVPELSHYAEGALQPDDFYSIPSIGDQLRELIRAINPRDRLLIRGLSKFLTAQALQRERWYLEEAGIAAFISLEAALTIIRQHLEFTRGRSASFDDAYDYLRVTFPTGQPLSEWLRELYDLRVIAVHPSSRFGEFWAPPMDVEHCFETIDWLITLYRHILLGEVPPADAA